MKIWTVDAFASKPFTGNPAAVTIVAEFPSDDVCIKIAAEMNLSETAFVKPLDDGSFHIKWFTPLVDIDLCGHATLATAHILFQEGMVANNTVNLESRSGPLSVEKNGDQLTLNFPLQKVDAILPVEAFIEQLDFDEPIIAAVQAVKDVILELESPKAVRQLNLDPKDILKLDCRDLIVTAKGDKPYDFVSRVFAPSQGIDEDPVTGSAHCKLAHYWQQKLNKDTFLAYQASKRGGEIQITIKDDRVLLTGKAITIMEGNWLV
jgi:PhzF family phenazine biosynthesis protein